MLKSFIRLLLLFFHLDITKNLSYDRLSIQLMRKYIRQKDNCIDVGAHKGEILIFFRRYANQGFHQAFEPIPVFYEELKSRFKENIQIYPFALSNQVGKKEFQWVKNAPAYSGFMQRKYAIKHPLLEKIQVESRRLDDFQSLEKPIRLIKIDVEGAEFLVLKGSLQTLKAHRPFVLFEFGLGSSEFYGSTAEELYAFFQELDYSLFTLKDAMKENEALSLASFVAHYQNNSEYYFWAAPLPNS
jgi:FkbM family methyltransferase